MIKKLKIPLSLGLTFYGIAYIVVKFIGYSSTSFMIISYLYIVLAAIIGLKYEFKNYTGSSSIVSSLKNIVIVAEGEEMRIKRLLTGEKYKIKGEIEKVQ